MTAYLEKLKEPKLSKLKREFSKVAGYKLDIVYFHILTIKKNYWRIKLKSIPDTIASNNIKYIRISY